MIKTKYVVGDVVVVNGKQRVIDYVGGNNKSIYEPSYVWYGLTTGEVFDEEELDASNY